MADSSNYYFRDDLEAEKQRKADAAAVAGPVTLAAPTAPVAPAAPAQAQTFGNLAKAAQAVKPAEEKPDYFADFRASLDAQDPFKQQAQKAVTDTLANPTAGFDAAAKAQEDKLGREIAAEGERRRQQSVIQFGGNQTGQVDKTMNSFGNEAIMKQAELGRDIAAGRAQAGEAARGNAINQSVALLGEGRTGAAQAAGLGLQQEGQREQNGLTKDTLALDKEKFYAGIGSQEKIAFAQLSQEDKALAQQAMLAGNQLEWDKQALKLGLDDRAADRIWQAAEGEKQRASQEKVAFAQIGSQEKLQATAQAFEGAQAELNRSLEKLLSNDKIAAQFQLSDMDHRFQEVMQEKGFVQEKDLEAMRADLQKSLQARGIDAATATQIADQKFTEMMASKDQAFQQQMNTIKQAFITGERVSSQDWESALHAGDLAHEETMAKLTSTLRLGEAANAQAFQTAFQGMQNEFSEKMATAGFSHEEAMQSVAQNFQLQLEREGYTHEEAMQGAQLAVQVSENQMNRASQELMAAAQLASSDANFNAELLQKYHLTGQELDIRRQEMVAQVGLMGLQGQQLEAAIQNDKVKSAMDIAALGMEIGNGSPEAMAPFVEQFGAALSGYMKEQGIDISSSDFVKAMTASTPTGSVTAADGFKGFSSIIDTKSNLTPEAADTLKNYMTSLTNAYASAKPGVMVSLSTGRGADFDEAARRLKSLGYTDRERAALIRAEDTGDPMMGTGGKSYTGTQAFADYAAYVKLLSSGLKEADAQAAITKLLGPTRTAAAFSLENIGGAA